MQLTGIHHLTAISAKPRQNLAFYTGLLGMRLVKKTVNQDDVSAYHLFYADGNANPGTDLTFFDFPAAPERRIEFGLSELGSGRAWAPPASFCGHTGGQSQHLRAAGNHEFPKGLAGGLILSILSPCFGQTRMKGWAGNNLSTKS